MPEPILTTRLWLPSLPTRIVTRPRLLERLCSQPDRRLTLICAPAGFGKTTLLAEWIHHAQGYPGQDRLDASLPDIRQTDFAWLALNEQDNDLRTFLRYLVAALQTVDGELGEGVMPVLEAAQTPEPRYVINHLINELASRNHRLVLTLDDYHIIDNPAVHKILTYLIDHQPSQLHLVVTSRFDPPLPLSRLRVRQQILELRAADLRFTAEEAAALLHRVWGLSVSAEQAASLKERTEGWAAGLQLAALALQQLRAPEEVTHFVVAFNGSHRYVLDYLVDEVLNQQSHAIQDFLLRTALLDRFCADLCSFVLEVDDAPELLKSVEKANLFLISLDDRHEWFRFHHLFSDLLRHRLQKTRASMIPVLHRRASLWYEINGFTTDAVRHALAAGDPERAADLVEAAWLEVRKHGEIATLQRWLDALPPDQVDRRGPLAVSRAWTLLYAGKMVDAEGYLARVEPALVGLVDSAPAAPWQVDLAVIRGQIALNHGHFEEALAHCQQARDVLGAEPNPLRGSLEIMFGHACQVQGDLAGAQQAYSSAAGIALQIEDRYLRLSALAALARLAEARGLLLEAQAIWEDASKLVTSPKGQPLPVSAVPQVGLGRLCGEWNRLEEALALLESAVRLARQAGLGPTVLTGSLALARVWQALGDHTRAHAALQQVEKSMQRSQLPLLDLRLGAAEAGLWLRQGNLARAGLWAKQFVDQYGLAGAEAPGDWFEFEYVQLARIWLAQERLQESADLLAKLMGSAAAAGRTGQVIEIMAVQALVQQAQDEQQGALLTLQRALELARPSQYIRTFVDEGQPMGTLLARLVMSTNSNVSAYAAQLLGVFDAPDRGRVSGAGVTHVASPDDEGRLDTASIDPARWLVEPLSVRETEVLKLVAAGLSNREVGQRLYISLSTVKKHMENIHMKLLVNKRTQAVARARELGIL